jgi:hypothetical protein
MHCTSNYANIVAQKVIGVNLEAVSRKNQLLRIVAMNDEVNNPLIYSSLEANMTEVFFATLDNLALALSRLSKAVPPPKLVEVSKGYPGWRYLEKTPKQAIVVKLARLLSALHAVKVLLDAGLVLDVGAIKRVIDETVEDVIFVARVLVEKTLPLQHERFLKEFWQEEFDDSANDELRNLERDRVPRKKIRAFNARLPGSNLDPETRQKVDSVISKTYSGYIHGAAAHTMEIYGGRDPKFHVSGMKNTSPWNAQSNDMPNYFYRAVCAFGIVAGSFGDQELLDEILKFREKLEQAFGMNFDDPSSR